MSYLQALRTSIIYIVAAIMGLNVVSITISVISRFVINLSLGWTDEIAGYSLVWITFLGAAWAVIDNDHIGFESLVESLPQKAQAFFVVTVRLLMIAACLLITYTGWNLVVVTWDNTAVSLPISKGFVMSVIPLSAMVMLVALLTQFLPARFSAGTRKEVKP
jgi:TRAP-type C4-dicarboxylate transport system permease small subunit